MDVNSKHSVLEVRDLAVGYTNNKEATVIADSLNFQLNTGSLTAIVGPNGVGKSTLLRTLTGMQKALGGGIYLEGEKLNTLTSLQIAQKISVVLTEPVASRNLTVRELVSLGRQPYTNWMGSLTKDDKDIIEQVLEKTDTLEYANRKCYQLSDGQLQRVFIARALVQDTPLIILDEPTTHLDLYHRAYVLKLLQGLTQDSGKAVLFTTHEIDLAIQLSDQLLVMSDKGCHFDTPEGHISHGNFADLFPSQTVHFDAESRRFTIKK